MDRNKYKLGSNDVTVTNIALRVSDIEQALYFYQDIMGMTYLSKQPVYPPNSPLNPPNLPNGYMKIKDTKIERQLFVKMCWNIYIK